jgi:hypothetical protein
VVHAVQPRYSTFMPQSVPESKATRRALGGSDIADGRTVLQRGAAAMIDHCQFSVKFCRRLKSYMSAVALGAQVWNRLPRRRRRNRRLPSRCVVVEMRASHLFVVSSTGPVDGSVVLERLACFGCCVITTDGTCPRFLFGSVRLQLTDGPVLRAAQPPGSTSHSSKCVCVKYWLHTYMWHTSQAFRP